MHKKHLTIISDDLIKQGNIYFDGNINKIVLIKNSLNEYLKHNESNKYDAFKLRVLLCKSQMTKMNESFNQYVTETIFNLSKEINNYEMIQTKYIYTLNWYVDYSKLENKRVLEKKIGKEIKLIFKSITVQKNIDLLQYSKEKFAKIIYDLNNKILTHMSNKNDSDLIYNYNLFINEYLIWTIYIIQYLSTINYDSKQYSIIRNILNLI